MVRSSLVSFFRLVKGIRAARFLVIVLILSAQSGLAQTADSPQHTTQSPALNPLQPIVPAPLGMESGDPDETDDEADVSGFDPAALEMTDPFDALPSAAGAWQPPAGRPRFTSAVTLTTVTPAGHALLIPANASIAATFSSNMNTATFTNSTIRVHGRESGTHTGTITPVGATGFTFDPADDFFPGELVSVTLTDAIETSGAQPLANGYHWTFSVAFTPGNGKFHARTNYQTGKTPSGIFLSDLSNDGKPDVAVANAGLATATVLTNGGSGTFAQRADPPVGGYPVALFVGDIDGIGEDDIVTANKGSNSVSLLMNNGGGSYAQMPDIPLSGLPRSVFVSDLDGNGTGDLVVARRDANKVSVFLNNGGGSFAPPSHYPTGVYPVSVFVSDLDNDGDNDLVTANRKSNKITVYKNNGDGIFSGRMDYPAGASPSSVFAGDLYGNGRADLAVTNYSSATVSILKNDGNGGFPPPPSLPHPPYATGVKPFFVVMSDINGDGKNDLAVSNYESKSVSILKNMGGGIFGAKDDYPTGHATRSVAVGDLDGDGFADLAASTIAPAAAIFLGNIYTLSVNPTIGTTTQNPNAASYSFGSEVLVTAFPPPGHHFIGWSGDAAGTANPLAVTMNADKAITAHFAPILFGKGLLWGLTADGGANDEGTLFAFDIATSTINTKVDFAMATGATPNGSLLLASDGKLYGVTGEGGANNAGVVFDYHIAANVYTKRADLSAATGSGPRGTLIEAPGGKLYGLASSGGANNAGTIFEFDMTSGSVAAKIDLTQAGGTAPTGALMLASDGKYYGTTSEGGAGNIGALFEYDMAANTYTKRADFPGDGFLPYGSLIEASPGKLYGATYGGNGTGMIFVYDVVTHVLTNKLNFAFATGRSCFGTLLKAPDGMLYGMVARGAASDLGAIFRYDPVANTYTNTVDLASATGSHPYGSLMLAADGFMYGLTTTGGAQDKGVVFRYDPATDTYAQLDDFVVTNGASPQFTHLVETASPDAESYTSNNWAYFPGATAQQPNSMSFFNGDTGLAVGNSGTISRTTDGGVSWALIAGSPLAGNLYAVSTHADSATAVVCGDSGIIGRTADYGATWTIVPSGTSSSLHGLTDDGRNYSEDLIVAVGDDGIILRSTDDGMSWSAQTSGTAAQLQSVTFFNPDTGVVTGGGLILRTDNGGTTWIPSGMIPKSAVRSPGMAAISTTRSNIKAGSCVVAGSGGSLQRSTNFGMTWVVAQSGTNEDLNAVTVAGGVFHVAGNNGTMLLSATGEDWISVDSRTSDDIVTAAVKEKGVQFTDVAVGTASARFGVHTPSSSYYVLAAGEDYCAGTSRSIAWTGGDPGDLVTLKLYNTVSKSIVITITDSAANDGSYLWQIPPITPDGSYAIYIEGGSPLGWAYGPELNISHCAPAGGSVVRGFVTEENSGVGATASIKNAPSAPMKVGDPIRGVDVSLGKKPSSVSFNGVTDSTGAFEFTGVEQGEYELTVTPLPGAVVAFPAEITYSFTVGASDTLDAMNFRLALTPPDAQWYPVETGTTVTLLGVQDCGGASAVAVGDSGTILYSDDGGATWNPAFIADTVSSFRTSSMGAGSPVNGVRVSCCPCTSKSIAVGGGGTVYVSTDAGAQWTPSFSGTSVDLNAVDIFDDGTAVAVGDDNTILRSIDGGLSWTPAAIIESSMARPKRTVGPGAPIKGIKVSCTNGSGHAVAVSSDGSIYGTTDFGSTWHARPSGTSAELLAVDYFDENHIIVTGDQVVLRSNDGGATWTTDPENQGVVRSIAAVDAATAYAVADGGGLLFTADRGATWSIETPSASAAGRNIAAGEAGRMTSATVAILGVAVGTYPDNYARSVFVFGEDGTLIRKLERASEPASIDMSSGWNLVSLPVAPAAMAAEDIFRFATSGAFGYENKYLATDTLEVGRGYWLKFGRASTAGILGTTVIEETVDVSARWNIIGSLSFEIEAASITSDPPGLVTSSFFGYSGGSYEASDAIIPGAGYWVKVGQAGRLILSAEDAVPSNRIRIVPTEELPPPPPGGESAPAFIPRSYALEQNYPNPFNPATTIGFDLPENGRVFLKVYDLMGRIVRTLADNQPYDAGRQRIEFDASELASGVYFYRISVDGAGASFHDLKKMVLIR